MPHRLAEDRVLMKSSRPGSVWDARWSSATNTSRVAWASSSARWGLVCSTARRRASAPREYSMVVGRNTDARSQVS